MANESRPYLTWIRQQKCCACRRKPAGEAHHTGRKGTGQRTHDSKAIPMCREHHQALEDLHNEFKGFVRDTREAFEEMALELTQRRAHEAGWRWRDGKAYRVATENTGAPRELAGEVF